jgi:hypothetical protein
MEFPKLMWSAGGLEVTVHSQAAQDAMVAEGYTLTAPDVSAAVPAEDTPAPAPEPEPEPEPEPSTRRHGRR